MWCAAHNPTVSLRVTGGRQTSWISQSVKLCACRARTVTRDMCIYLEMYAFCVTRSAVSNIYIYIYVPIQINIFISAVKRFYVEHVYARVSQTRFLLIRQLYWHARKPHVRLECKQWVIYNVELRGKIVLYFVAEYRNAYKCQVTMCSRSRKCLISRVKVRLHESR